MHFGRLKIVINLKWGWPLSEFKSNFHDIIHIYILLRAIENYISIFWFWRWTLLWREQTWFFNYINSTDKVQYNKIGIVLAFFPHKDIVFIFCHISTSICSDHICYHFWLYYCLQVIIYKHLKISKKVKYSYILGI